MLFFQFITFCKLLFVISIQLKKPVCYDYGIFMIHIPTLKLRQTAFHVS